METLKTPRNSREISQAWLQGILTQLESKTHPGTSVEVTSFQVNPGAKPGENFGSDLVRLEVEARVTSDDGKQDRTADLKTYHLIAKFLVGTEVQQEFMKQSNAHLRELLVYSHVIADLNHYQSSKISPEDKYRIDVPKLIYGKCTNKEYVLVIENLKPAGFVNADKREGLNLDEALMAAESLAKLHGLSYSYGQEVFNAKYPQFQVQDHMKMFMTSFLSVSLESILKFLASQKDLEGLHKKIKSCSPVLMDSLMSVAFRGDAQKFKCLCHSDFWINNFMFKYGEAAEEHKPMAIMLIDWQTATWQNPLLDLQYLVHISCPLTLRQNHLDDILRHYYSTFTAITAHLNDPVISSWSYENFKEEWDKNKILGAVTGIIASMMTLSEARKTLREKDLQRNPSEGVAGKVKTSVAKMIVPFLKMQVSQPLMKSSLRKMLSPVLNELEAGSNEFLKRRILDILLEADEKGVFDI